MKIDFCRHIHRHICIYADRHIVAAFFALILLCVSSSGLHARELVILHTNDTHSHIEPIRTGENAGRAGVIERAVFVDSVRNAAGAENVLLVDAGDFSQGTSYFNLLGGDIEVDVMNALGYDVACLGNHEFDNGPVELARRLRNVKFPVVCANYDFRGTVLDGLVKPYVIVEKSGLKIGIIGILTDISTVVVTDESQKVKYLDPAGTVAKYAARLKKRHHCDLVICLTHIGFEDGPVSDKALAAETKNVDLIIGGHSHTFIKAPAFVNNKKGSPVPIVTDGNWGINVGLLELQF